MIILFYFEEKKLKIVQDNKVMEDLYEGISQVPNRNILEKYLSDANNNIKKFFEYDYDSAINKIKINISKINYKIPLYDEYSENMFLVSRELVYQRVIYNYYRFPSHELINILKEKQKRYNEYLKDEYKNINLYSKKSNKKIKNSKNAKNLKNYGNDLSIHYIQLQDINKKKRKAKKLNLMIEFLNNFDVDVLFNTYVYVFYNFSKNVGREITVCKRPSFLPHFEHIQPYYKKSEIINMALNMNLIDKNKADIYDDEQVMELCNKIKKNDLSSNIILEHQKHIIKNNKIGIVQYYSLQGSYFINMYLRNFVPYNNKNILLENVIKSMKDLVQSAPAFNKNYTLYRFVKNDDYLKHININETYTDPGFISCTRNPFYRSDIYKFGFILIKINIPANKKGVALCIESMSHFPEEEEIILAPQSILKLKKKDKNVPYYHTDQIFKSKINIKYEFDYVGTNNEINYDDKPISKDYRIIDFLNIEKITPITLKEKIGFFISKYTNEMYQFKTKIGNKYFDIITEWFDSSSVYNKFYASNTNNGFSMYSFIDNYLAFLIELESEDGKDIMYLNHYFRYSMTNYYKKIKDYDLIMFVSKIAHYFDIETIIIYNDYVSCDIKNKYYEISGFDKFDIYFGGNICIDFYNYLKFKKKRFSSIDSYVIKPAFSYLNLDNLYNISPSEILKRDDKDELYQIYKKTYIEKLPKNDNLADFYVWISDNNCKMLNTLVHKINNYLAPFNNPFISDYYILYPHSFLYNNNLIDYHPIKNIKSYSIDDSEKYINKPKNNYRLENRNIDNYINRLTNSLR